jgi:hypothetical protein
MKKTFSSADAALAQFWGVVEEPAANASTQAVPVVKPMPKRGRGAVVIREGMDDYRLIPSRFGSVRKLPGGGVVE